MPVCLEEDTIESWIGLGDMPIDKPEPVDIPVEPRRICGTCLNWRRKEHDRIGVCQSLHVVHLIHLIPKAGVGVYDPSSNVEMAILFYDEEYGCNHWRRCGHE